MPNLEPLIGKSRAELEQIVVKLGHKPYRGRQIAHWLYEKAAQTFDDLQDLPKNLREQLEKDYIVSPLFLADHRKSTDNVDKILVHNGDNQVFEAVLLPYEKRVSCCISSQIGCPMGCTFCATGMGGFDRNLTASEIVAQYLYLQSLTDRRISHVVFMGMGEPLLNFDNVVAALTILHEEVGLSYRNLTVSTVGLVLQILKLAELKLPIHLALSLHSANDSIRSNLMPVNNRWDVAETWGAMKKYQRITGRKVMIEYLLISELNDTPEQAEALAQLVRGTPHVVNLIPFNWVDTGNGFQRPARSRINTFKSILEQNQINVTERVERGHDIAAACGQLAGQHQGKFARRTPSNPLTVVP
ncbi:MAG: 23S rRNA (adenine(2503)-C(2))-methyltransferase RlmN [Fimbriimonadaceae bacterium]